MSISSRPVCVVTTDLWLKAVIVLAREPISRWQLRFGLGRLGGRTAPAAAGTAAAVVLGKHVHLLMVQRPRTLHQNKHIAQVSIYQHINHDACRRNS